MGGPSSRCTALRDGGLPFGLPARQMLELEDICRRSACVRTTYGTEH